MHDRPPVTCGVESEGGAVAETDPVVEVGPVAHGGHCVARLDGQVVFVRHALPGEVVQIRITERSRKFLRADAIRVLQPSPDRVEPPCPLSGPGLCGGCDFQHVSAEGQLTLLTDVVREQLQRLAGLEWTGRVEAVGPLLDWRTRVVWSVAENGMAGLRRHRSHDVLPIPSCPIAHPDLPDVTEQTWDEPRVESIVSSTGQRLLVTDATIGDRLETEVDGVVASDGTVRAGTGTLVERVHGRDFRVSGSGFWQVHPAAATTLVDAVMEAAEVRPGDRVLDLYAGAGLFSAFLAPACAPGELVSVEGNRRASANAAENLADLSNASTVHAPVERALARGTLGARADVVVLDPPRQGAKDAVTAIAALEPRRIVYVACDPAALARDVATFATLGYRLESLRGFALFPMTHHVECVVSLARD
ncbi:TRAM domain-containing protein [Aeromicrobium sp. 636]|uniref:Class I SAM-dependent RNA methyltransferase n=1 Tax=Aeromicrobium senzhongii TaxID=2663859 RepID=A0A8I0ER70_9ACTN|nr:class I SAM-dependent RNA methyltransferase [Aeromicrobium senzhongii]MBC9224896.1 class I SAM-dependent RNA methyltransferase [Aeromicrobium senzhongii]MCQ3997008.1 TRAM domain-containing protein [Aeromicrobium sp. 636]